MHSEIGSIIEAVRKHHELYKNALPLIASENVTSKAARMLLSSDLSHRYAEGELGNRFYEGCEYIDEIEEIAIRYAKRLFNSPHVNIKPTSGVNANIATFFALTSPFDKIMALSLPEGGHISHSRYSTPGIRNLIVENHPFNAEEMNIDADAMIKDIKKKKPALILFGGSLFLFPHPVLAAKEAAEEIGARILYDASHVLGLIAGKKFQEPLKEGADVVTGSTHKTFPGPQGAIILCREDLKEKIDKAVFPGTVSNHHLHHIAALAITLVEMMHFGEEYASQIVSNAKTLAQCLYEENFNVLCEKMGFTMSHQIAIDVNNYGSGAIVAKELAKANIITNKNMLPFDKDPEKPSGIRLGVQELTRLGMKESEMKEIASLIKRRIINGKNAEIVKKEVIELRKDFKKVHYCFNGNDACQEPPFKNGGLWAQDPQRKS